MVASVLVIVVVSVSPSMSLLPLTATTQVLPTPGVEVTCPMTGASLTAVTVRFTVATVLSSEPSVTV